LLITAGPGILNISESENCWFWFLEKEEKIRIKVISKKNLKEHVRTMVVVCFNGY
jgi:hypothetical protein